MASQPPSASTPTMPSDGIAVSAGLYRAVSRIIRSRDANSFSLVASSRSCSCRSLPNPLTTRTPPLSLLPLAEPLNPPPPADGLVHHPGHLAGLLLGVPARREQLAPRRERDDQQRGRDRDGDEGEHRRTH